jgi:hypothetical protein
MDRLAGGPNAGHQRVVVVLGVDQPRLDVVQAVVAPPAFVTDAAHVKTFARNGACGKRHRGVRGQRMGRMAKEALAGRGLQ